MDLQGLSAVQLFYAYLSSAVLLLLAGLYAFGILRFSKQILVALCIGLIAATFFLQVGERVVFEYVAGALSPLSAAFWVFAISALSAFATGRSLFTQSDELIFCAAVFLFSAIIYAFSIGYSGFDLFALGYGVWTPAVFALGVGVLSLLTGSRMLAVWLAIAGLLKLAGVVETDNVFVFIIDPVAWAISLGLLFAHVVHRMTGFVIPFPGYRLSARPGKA